MTQEEKQLLLKDLCARLPYGLQIHIINDDYEEFQSGEFDNTFRYHHLEPFVCDRIEIKPYLRPMSSMTEDEGRELNSILPCGMSFSIDCHGDLIIYTDSESDGDHYFSCFVEMQDYLNAHHFDYRGLIGKGLALEAPKGMYTEEDKQ